MKPKRIVDKELLKNIKSLPCLACGKQGDTDPAHIKTRGSGGDDTEWNLIALCRSCHATQHRIGWIRFGILRPSVERELKKKGWYIERQCGRHKYIRSES